MTLYSDAWMLASAVSNSDVRLEFWAAMGAAAGVFLFCRGFSMLRYKRIILNTPSSRVRSASIGLVEINGLAKGPRTIPAGITGESCYYYRAMAWQMRGTGRNRNWKKVADESFYVPFFVEDSTGRMLVNPQGAELDIHCNFKDKVGDSFFGGDMPENASHFLLRNGISGSETTRLEEYCIQPDNPLFVLGSLASYSGSSQWISESDTPVDLSPSHSRLNLFGPSGTAAFQALGWMPGLKVDSSSFEVPIHNASESEFVTTPNINRDRGSYAAAAVRSSSWSSVSIDEEKIGRGNIGVATREEPTQAPATPQAASQFEHRQETAGAIQGSTVGAATDVNGAFDLRPPAVICKGALNEPFMISWHSQREVVRSLAWKSTLCIWGGPILTIVCLYFLFVTWGLT